MSELEPGDFGYRRKRNIEMDWSNKQESATEEHALGINWDKTEGNDEPEEDTEIVSVITNNDAITEKYMQEIRIGNKLLVIKRFQPKEKIQEAQKLTIYLEESLIKALKLLKKNKAIESYSQCIRNALIEYLTK